MKNHSVLVVDDEPSIVISLEYLLSQAGYDVHTASDGQQALVAVSTLHPRLVLLDVMMPVMNGFEVCRRIRDDPALVGTRILMLSAKGRDVEISQGMTLGADAYITKPFATRELMAAVARLMQPSSP